MTVVSVLVSLMSRHLVLVVRRRSVLVRLMHRTTEARSVKFFTSCVLRVSLREEMLLVITPSVTSVVYIRSKHHTIASLVTRRSVVNISGSIISSMLDFTVVLSSSVSD
jgi:hypothetical protein